jgi:hypothetical protein
MSATGGKTAEQCAFFIVARSTAPDAQQYRGEAHKNCNQRLNFENFSGNFPQILPEKRKAICFSIAI